MVIEELRTIGWLCLDSHKLVVWETTLIPSTLVLQIDVQVSVFVLSSACETSLLLSHGSQQFIVTQSLGSSCLICHYLDMTPSNHSKTLKEQWKSTTMIKMQNFQWRRTSFQWHVTIAHDAYVCSMYCIQPTPIEHGSSATSTLVLDHCLASLEKFVNLSH